MRSLFKIYFITYFLGFSFHSLASIGNPADIGKPYDCKVNENTGYYCCKLPNGGEYCDPATGPDPK
ncbi:hypothetical protein [Arsenophonus sp. PmNCSU2021_1]|uniref:hypothetical protein n=1 Tax=Arsenophonus sp. PmNCSU2021_1 TaxID=3118989 RepID=UPI002FEFC500